MLIEVSRSLNSKLDLRSIIRQILQAVLQVIPAADSGTLYIYESQSDRLVVYDTVGLGPEMFDVAIRPGRGITGRAFENQSAHLYSDGDAVVEHMRDGGDENLRRYAAASGGMTPPKSAMTAPMLYKDKPIGVLVAHNLTRPGIFNAFDMRLLDSLAQTAALAMAEHGRQVVLEYNSAHGREAARAAVSFRPLRLSVRTPSRGVRGATGRGRGCAPAVECRRSPTPR